MVCVEFVPLNCHLKLLLMKLIFTLMLSKCPKPLSLVSVSVPVRSAHVLFRLHICISFSFKSKSKRWTSLFKIWKKTDGIRLKIYKFNYKVTLFDNNEPCLSKKKLEVEVSASFFVFSLVFHAFSWVLSFVFLFIYTSKAALTCQLFITHRASKNKK